MSSGLSADNPTIVAAFKAALLHQGLVALLVLALLAVVWQVLQALEVRRASAAATGSGGATAPVAAAAAETALLPLTVAPEALARRVLRIGFGCLWVLDGILQAQPQMPLGMTTGVLKPVAAASPTWVQQVVNAGATVWSFHPVEAAAAAVWIQLGIGLWLLVAPRGNWSRAAGATAAGWGLVVWVFGEAFGGIFVPGQSWLFGTPGGVLFYVAAGILVALPDRRWATPRLGRAVLAVMGLFFAGMAVLQAWPGRGFWQGRLDHGAVLGTLATMSRTMAKTPQPHLLSAWVSDFEAFDVAHGFAVNLFVVVALAAIGIAFLAGRTPLLRFAVGGCCVLCLATWVLVQDFGFFGGVGTDPNSMVPMALLVVAGYLALVHAPAADTTLAPVSALGARQRPRARVLAWWEAVVRHPGYLLRTLVALGAVGIVALGAAPMAFATIDRTADPIIYQATDGAPQSTDFAARPFHLVDEEGRPVSLHSLRGKTVALTFLDPVCTSDCPLIGQDFRIADGMLGSIRSRVDLVAIVANPLYRQPSYLDAYDDEEGMERLSNWRYLTGSLSQLESAWTGYGVEVDYEPGGAMVGHSELTYVIDPRGHVRWVLQSDPGTDTEASSSSFAVSLADAIRSVAGAR